mgnify:CR=1 FL=1
MKTLEEQLNEWKAKRAESEEKMGQAINEKNRLMYECAQNDWNNANSRISGILEAMNK